MKFARLYLMALALLAATAAWADDDGFIIGVYLDPYSAHTNADSTVIQEYFDSLKAFGANRVIGIGNSVTTGQGQPNAFGRFKVIPRNAIGGNEVVVTSDSGTLENFTDYGWHMTLEVENLITADNLREKGYGFYRQTGIPQSNDTVVAVKDQHTAGYLFSGPGSEWDYNTDGVSLLYFSPKFVRPGTWGRADYILKLDTTGAGAVPDTAVVARLVVYNANVYRAFGHLWGPAHLVNSSTCDPDRGYPLDTIYFCHSSPVNTTFPDSLLARCGLQDTYTLKYDDSVLADIDTSQNPDVIRSVSEAFVRDLRKADFCRAGQWETLSVHFYQTFDNPFNYSLYWTSRVTLIADKVIVSNDIGRKFFSANNSEIRDSLQNYYEYKLQDTIPRMYLTDEPYPGSYPVLRRAKDRISSPTSSRRPSSVISGYTDPGVGAYQWDVLNSIVNPDEFNLELGSISCRMPRDISGEETDPCNIQFSFAATTRGMAYLSSRAKQPQINKRVWPWVYPAGFYGDYSDSLHGWPQILRIPTPAEVKVVVNLALAYGAKGILYYPYTTTGDQIFPPNPNLMLLMPHVPDGGGGGGCPSCPIAYGSPPYRISGVMRWDSSKYVKRDTLWDSVRSINVNILKKLGPTLMTLTWDTAGPGAIASASTHGFLNSVTSANFVSSSMFIEVAHFTGGGADYFMLVNRRCYYPEGQNVTAWLNKPDGSMYYVINVLTGDTVLTGGTTGGAPFTTTLAAAEGKLFKVVPAPQYIHGTVNHVAWQGKITVDGDVTVSSGKTLKVLPPQAQLSFLANRDTTHSGVDANKCEFIVPSGGKLIADGNSNDPLKFLSSSGTPGTQDWRGLIVKPGGYLSMSNAVIRHAYAGIDDRSQYLHSIQNVRIGRCKMYGILAADTDSLTIRGCRVDSINAQPGGYGIHVSTSTYGGKGARLVRDTTWACYNGMFISSSTTTVDSCLVQASDWLPSATGIITQSQALESGDSLPINFTKIAGFFAYQHLENNVDGYVALHACSLFSPYIGDRSPYGIRNTANNARLRLRRSRVTEWNGTGVLLKHNASQVINLGRVTGGVVDSGFNWIFTTTTYPNWKYVWDQDCGSCTTPIMYAEWNCWGSGAPSASRFTGNIDRTPYDVSCIQAPKVAVGEGEEQEPLPRATELFQNYPNPFNPTTLIQFNLQKPERVSLEIFNILGQKVRTLLSGEQFAAGPYRFVWDGKDDRDSPVSSGMYVYKLQTPTYLQAKKMVLVK